MMKRILRPSGQVEPLKKNWSRLFDYEILIAFNYDGVCNKESFKKFKYINKAIFGKFSKGIYIILVDECSTLHI